MALRYSRETCLTRLRTQIEAGRAIVMTGAGNGLAAKFIERGGVDLIGIYNTGYFRMQGYGSLAGMLPILDANKVVFRTAEREVLPQVRTTPVVAGVNGVDPLRDLPRFLVDLARIGISGVHNFPTVAWFDGNFRRSLEATGLGYGRELEMLRTARDLDLLTVGYAFNAEDVVRLNGGRGARYFYLSRRDHRGRRDRRRRSHFSRRDRRAKRNTFRAGPQNPAEVVLLAHGAAIVDPEHAQYMVDHTGCHGVQLGSSIERLAVEGPIEARAAAFKATRLPGGRSQ